METDVAELSDQKLIVYSSKLLELFRDVSSVCQNNLVSNWGGKVRTLAVFTCTCHLSYLSFVMLATCPKKIIL